MFHSTLISIAGLDLMTGTFCASHVIHKAETLATSFISRSLSVVWRIEMISAAGGTPPSRWEAVYNDGHSISSGELPQRIMKQQFRVI